MEADQDSQRILWRGCNKEKEADVHVLQVMTFGATCSPFCAQYVKNRNAEKFGKIYPEATKAIQKQHYVDDYLDSFSSIDEAKRIVNQVIEIHQHAGYYIRNFISNDTELLESIPVERRHKSSIKPMEDKDSSAEKVLGTRDDCLAYQIKWNKYGDKLLKNEVTTMREVLAYIMSIYDPLGLISNLSIHGRMLMQELHKATTKWDDPIPTHLQEQWRTWIRTIKEAENLSIPRCITYGNVEYIELHTFVDASDKAFAAGVYARSTNQYGSCVRLIAGKARVAPIKGLSIPRLELQAAVLGTRLANLISKELRLKISKTYFWSDSQTVLSWIKKIHVKLHPFVVHRIGEIFLPSEKNPADAATKMTSYKTIWLNGPEFLRSDEDDWPKQTKKEIDEFVAHHSKDDDEIYIEERGYSNWWKLIKHLCILKKFSEWSTDKNHFVKAISIENRRAAENYLYEKAQWQGFREEMEDLLLNGQVSKTSSINNLNPFLDEFGVMRSKGRLEKAMKLSQDTRTPIILPQKTHITKLVVRSIHERYLHQGENSIIAALQQKYWIINARAVVKKI